MLGRGVQSLAVDDLGSINLSPPQGSNLGEAAAGAEGRGNRLAEGERGRSVGPRKQVG